ncbi:MAG: CDP-diacylglycerol--serine O-phosphatidyltransferase [Candidatus Hydrogenedentota bacterium]|nr:MAG: CDP-diacylglycerol--serine O-phosphatidyltransferase [Candidatus Hydrogenedentota bacterium]
MARAFRRKRRGSRRSRERLERVRRGIFLVPTLMTLTNLSCGFLAILFSVEGHFRTACLFLIAAMFADVLDGATARFIKHDSSFGKQIDSLADVVSFGVAPAILVIYRFHLGNHPFWIFPLFYVVAGALRLARYNAFDAPQAARNFRGTPIPAPAGMIVGFVLLLDSLSYEPQRRVVVTVLFLFSCLMLSSIDYPSLRKILRPDTPRPFRSLVLVLLVFVLLIYRFVETWLVLGTLYYISGPIWHLMTLRQRRRGVTEETASAETSSSLPPSSS